MEELIYDGNLKTNLQRSEHGSVVLESNRPSGSLEPRSHWHSWVIEGTFVFVFFSVS